MAKQHVPLTVRAREVIDRAGGLKHINADQLCQELKITKKAAWRILWMMRNRPNTGKAERGPYSRTNGTTSGTQGTTNGFIHPSSAAARLLGVDTETTSEEQAFLAIIQLIGVSRAEALLHQFKDRLTQAIKGVV